MTIKAKKRFMAGPNKTIDPRLQTDFWEKTNLAEDGGFENLCKELLDQITNYASAEGESSTIEMDEELKENLRALGYIK